MRVGVWAQPEDLSDRGLRFLRQIGVEALDVSLDLLPEYEETGRVSAATLRELADRVEAAGMQLELVTFSIKFIKNAYFDLPGGDGEIDNLCRTVESVGSAGIPLLGMRPNNAGYWPPSPPPGYSKDSSQTRGGYERHSFDWDLAKQTMDEPAGKVREEEPP